MQAQSLHSITFRDYFPVENTDSLEKMIAAKQDDTYEYTLALLRLERSRYLFADDKFGSHLNLLDSIRKKFNFINLQAAYYYLFSNYAGIKRNDKVMALQYTYKALDLYTQQRDISGMIQCYFNLEKSNVDKFGYVSGNIAIAENYMNRIIKLADISNFPEDKLYKLLAVERYYYKFHDKNIDTIAKLANQGIDIIKVNPQLNYLKHSQLNYLANYYFFKNNYKRSASLHLECLSLISDSQYQYKTDYFFNVANDYSYMGDYPKAEYYYKASIEFCKNRDGLLLDYQVALVNLAIMQYNEQKYDEACSNFMISDSLTRSVRTKMYNKDFADMQVKYETEKKELANQVLQKEKRTYEIASIIAILLLGMISVLLFYLLRKNRQLDEYALFRDQIFSIISHDLRSPVMALEGLSKQAIFLIEKNETQKLELLGQKLDASILRLNGLLNNLLAWAMSQDTRVDTKMESLLLFPLVNDIVLLYADISSAKQIRIEISINENFLVKANRNGLNVILRNLIDNAVKNSGNGVVSITAATEQNIIIKVMNSNTITSPEKTIAIQNQLQSIKKENPLKTASGFGLQLVAHFVRLHKGSVTMESSFEKGTVFTLVLPA